MNYQMKNEYEQKNIASFSNYPLPAKKIQSHEQTFLKTFLET